MRFKLKIGFGKKSGHETNPWVVLGNFWQKIYMLVFFICLVAAILLGFYIWQKSLMDGAWSAEKKQEYLNSQNNSVVLKESDYKKALADIESRKNANIKSGNQNNALKDIFKSY